MTQDLKAPSVGMLVGARVRALRMFKGWTQTQLGEHALVDKTAICRMESGANNPSLFILALIAPALDVDLTDLLATGPDEPSPGDAHRAAQARSKAGFTTHKPGSVGLRVGAALKALRAARGLTQERMALALKVDPGTLSRVESGTRIPILANLYRLCTAYGTTPYRALLPTLDDRSYDDGQRSKFRA